MSDSLWSHGLQHARLPCPSPSPGVCSNSCLLSQWCHPTISSSVTGFPVLHHLLEVAQTHVFWASDAIQPSHYLSPASLSFTISRSLLRLMSFEPVMPSNHLIICHPLLLLPSILPSIRVLSNELAFHIRWPKYSSFSFSVSPSNEYLGLIPFRIDWFDLLVVQASLKVFSSTTIQKHQFFGAQSSLWSNSHIHT